MRRGIFSSARASLTHGRNARQPEGPRMTHDDSSPFNAIPPLVVALAVVVSGLEAMFQLAGAGMLGGSGGVGWRIAAITDYAVLDNVGEWMRANRYYPPEHLVRFIAYPLIHAGITHAAFVVVFLLAMGKLVAETFSAMAFLVIFWVSAIVGGVAFVLLLNSPLPLIGGYPGVYGLIGAFSYIQWVGLKGGGENQYRAFVLIGILLAVQLIFATLNGQYGDIVADIAGFVTGFALSFVLSPGGWHRLLVTLRRR
jgi:membrane associated rhomboid family serine protease